MALGFTESKEDSKIFFKVEGGIPMMLLLYVDDLFIIGKEELIKYARRRLAVKFEIKDLGMMHYFIGMEVWKSADGIFLGQGKYAVEILKRFRMMDFMTTPMASNLKLLSDASSESVDATMYRQMIGFVMHPTNTRPYIFFVVNTLIYVHLMVENNAVRYLRGTIDYGLMYEVN